MSNKLLVIRDRNGRIQRFNAACEALTGYSESEVRGQPCWELFAPAGAAPARAHAFDALVTGGGHPELRRDHLAWVARDGSVHHVAWHYALVHDEHGAVMQVLCLGDRLEEPAVRPPHAPRPAAL